MYYYILQNVIFVNELTAN